VVLVSNVIQGLTISDVTKRSGLSLQSGDLQGEAMKVTPQEMNDDYSSQGFKINGSIWEKILFSAPEYFVFETRIGTWILLKLQHALEFINIYTATKIPKSKRGMLIKSLEFSTDLIAFVLTHVTQARRNYYLEKEKQNVMIERNQPYSLYQIRKHEVDRILKIGSSDSLRRQESKKPKPSGTE
jgi:hypothetical protein